MRPSILVVVVAYRSASILRRCIESILTDPDLHELVVVDNSSEQATASLCDEFDGVAHPVKLIDPGQNLGFAAGCNLGVREAGEGWTHVFFLNPDVTLSRPLSELARVLDGSPFAIIAALLTSPSHPKNINARPAVTPARELRKALQGSRAYDMELDAGPGELVRVDQVDGALLGLTEKNFALLGGFDTRFELYYEDVDLCVRARAIGGCGLVAAEWGTHVGGASYALSPTAYALNRISRVRYLRKRLGRRGVAAALNLGIACVEWAARSISRQREGISVRSGALALQLREIRKPGSVRLLAR